MTGEPLPFDAYVVDCARAWEAKGVRHLNGDDTEAAIAALKLSVCYGGMDAMLWLGLGIVREAFERDDADLYLMGLGWLCVASLAGVDHAHAAFSKHYDVLPCGLLEAWHAGTPYRWAGLAVH